MAPPPTRSTTARRLSFDAPVGGVDLDEGLVADPHRHSLVVGDDDGDRTGHVSLVVATHSTLTISARKGSGTSAVDRFEMASKSARVHHDRSSTRSRTKHPSASNNAPTSD